MNKRASFFSIPETLIFLGHSSLQARYVSIFNLPLIYLCISSSLFQNRPCFLQKPYKTLISLA
ncbi:hypothetical protein Hanom_Chr05g00421901 [Helianthus anomalus]